MSTAKRPKPYRVVVDHVTYEDFPEHDDLLPLSTNLIRSFLGFLKNLGICTHKSLEQALSAKTPEEADAILRKCRVIFNGTEGERERALQVLRLWQKKVLHDDASPYKVSMREVLKNTQNRNKFFKYDAVEHEVSLKLLQLQRQAKGSSSKAINKDEIAVNYSDVERIYKNCSLEPIHDWQEARKSPRYLHTLFIECFPHVTYQMFKEYLFGDTVAAPRAIFDFCSHHGIERFNRQFGRRFLEEHLAFIKWAGGNPETFLVEQRAKIWSNKYL